VREFVSVHVADSEAPGIATLLISRPPTNALSRQVCRELTAAADEVGRRDDVTAVILFGGHEIFSAGSDVVEIRTLDTGETAQAADVCRAAVDAVAAIPKPTVAAITGYALGSGLTLALAADWRVSGDNVKFGSTEILDGLAPAPGGAARLARAIGESRARDLVFTGRFAGAPEALTMGLVDELSAPDHVYDAARTWALRFAGASVEALAAAKAAFVTR
jgi:enoyl-CoA hydratase